MTAPDASTTLTVTGTAAPAIVLAGAETTKFTAPLVVLLSYTVRWRVSGFWRARLLPSQAIERLGRSLALQKPDTLHRILNQGRAVVHRDGDVAGARNGDVGHAVTVEVGCQKVIAGAGGDERGGCEGAVAVAQLDGKAGPGALDEIGDGMAVEVGLADVEDGCADTVADG